MVLRDPGLEETDDRRKRQAEDPIGYKQRLLQECLSNDGYSSEESISKQFKEKSEQIKKDSLGRFDIAMKKHTNQMISENQTVADIFSLKQKIISLKQKFLERRNALFKEEMLSLSFKLTITDGTNDDILAYLCEVFKTVKEEAIPVFLDMLLEIKKKPNSNEVIKESFDEIIELLEIIFEDTNDIVFKNGGKDEYYIYTVNKDSRSISIRRYYTEEHSEEVGQTLADRISRLTQS